MNSQYLGPVIPGTIADIEEKQNKIECLTEEIKELEWNIESLEKMMEYYKKREKKEPVMNNFSFEVCRLFQQTYPLRQMFLQLECFLLIPDKMILLFHLSPEQPYVDFLIFF